MATIPDLTKQAPRSPRVRLGGYVLLPRMLDKGRATIAGKNGEYHYSCPLDKRFLEFKGIDPDVLRKELAAGKAMEKSWNGSKKTLPTNIPSLKSVPGPNLQSGAFLGMRNHAPSLMNSINRSRRKGKTLSPGSTCWTWMITSVSAGHLKFEVEVLPI